MVKMVKKDVSDITSWLCSPRNGKKLFKCKEIQLDAFIILTILYHGEI